ncbi:GAF domain-containing protein [Streptomyces roseirectus]|uniref:GAF domain-containing protein n=1 Tax=Streptomyces roseirectus TaxID=2768066 RepID=A0A7H0IJC0_9ACTN|nr:GAF domain-containing protein [Streptomyces roseirectus]QNP72886.1 GAF domain-containing protein [Streptomyces roseirectus]
MRLDALLAIGTDPELTATVRHIVDAAAELTGARYAVVETGRCDAPVLHVPVEGYGRLHLAGGRPSPALDVLAARAARALAGARLHEAARQRERWIEGAAAVTNALLGEGSSADPLMTVADRARLLADAAAGVVLQPTPEGGMEIVAASTHDDPGDIVGATIRPGSAVLAQLLGGEPVFIDDSATDPRMTTHVRHRFGPSMMLPLQADGRLIGTLALPRRREGRPYTDTEKHLAVQFASQAAVTLLLADARHRRARLAVYEDRDRIARDLHDLVIQRLFATGMMLQATGRRAGGAGEASEAPNTPSGDARARQAIDTAVAELEATVQQIRTAIFDLQQPPAEPPSGLRARLLREAAATLGTQPSVRFTGPVDALIPDHLAPTLLAALRKALDGRTRADIEVIADGRHGTRLVVDSTVVWEAPAE